MTFVSKASNRTIQGEISAFYPCYAAKNIELVKQKKTQLLPGFFVAKTGIEPVTSGL
jgi:hypothetical protein